MSRGNEYSRDASEYGQLKIAEALEKMGASVSTDKTLTKEDVAAEAKAVGDAVGKLSSNGNYIKKSTTKNVCENLGLLDTQVKANADAIALKASSSDVSALISNDGTTKTLFGLVVSINAETGAVTLSAPEAPAEQGEG